LIEYTHIDTERHILFGAAIIAISYWMVLVCIGSSADSALKAALYRYATMGKVAPGFTEETFRRPWRKQGKPSWRATWGPMKPWEI